MEENNMKQEDYAVINSALDLINAVEAFKKKMTVKAYIKGVDKHELVYIDVVDLPKTIRKIYGMALDEKQERFFEMLGFKLEAETKTEKFYALYPK